MVAIRNEENFATSGLTLPDIMIIYFKFSNNPPENDMDHTAWYAIW